jgi:hypothetical protein
MVTGAIHDAKAASMGMTIRTEMSDPGGMMRA